MREELAELRFAKDHVSKALVDLNECLEPFEQRYKAFFVKPLSKMSVLEKLKTADFLIRLANDLEQSPADSDS